MACSMLVASSGMLETHPAAESTQSQFAMPRGVLLLTALLIDAAMLVQGVTYNWSVRYLQEELGARQQRAALMFVSTAASTAVTRFAGDRARPSERAVVVGGALLSALAMSIVLLSVRAGLAIVGFAVVGIGLATIEPILYNDSTRVRSISRAGAIASVCSIGGFGFMIGPPIIAALLLLVGAFRVPLAGRVERVK